MNHFQYRHGVWHCEDVAIPSIADSVSTPFYVYSKAALLERYHAFDAAFGEIPHIICFAMKANPNINLNRVLAHEGCGAEVVSGGELYRSQTAGYRPDRVVFDGNGHTIDGSDAGGSFGILVTGNSGTLTNVKIKNVQIKDWYDGLYFKGVNGGRIESVTATSNTRAGISLRSANDNVVSGCTVSQNGQGFYIWSACSRNRVHST